MSDGPFRLVPDHMRDADTTGDLEAFLTAAWAGGVGPSLSFLAAADPDDGVAGTSHPVDPAYCPAAWLPWLARVLGADITGLTDEQARWYLSRRGRAAVGSDQGMKDAVAATLTGTRAVTITTPSVWEMTVTVDTAEVVDIAVTLAVALRNKPAGVDLTVTSSSLVTLADLDASYATLAAIAATGKTLDQLRFG